MSSGQAGGRPLLPVPSPITTKRSNRLLPRPPKASSACVECRKRRYKCSGGIPCDRCKRDQVACVVDRDSDQRRKGALERRLEALEHDRSLLLRLIGSLSDENEIEASEILRIIRSNASLDEIREYLDPKDKRTNELDQQPLYPVPAQPWTSVTDNSDYVSHLISLYFTWNHPIQTWIGRDIFIRDMQAGNTDCYYCSPFLVNAILAVACHYSELPGTRTATGTTFPGRRAFYNEARRLWDLEHGKFSLTNFQGQCELYSSTWAMSKHMLGWQSLIEIASCLPQIRAQWNSAFSKNDQKSQELVRASEIAFNGASTAIPIAFPTTHQPSLLAQPFYRRSLELHSDSDLWNPYPTVLESIPAHVNCVTNEVFELQLILWEISKSSSGAGSLTSDSADGFYRRLQEWAQNLPKCLSDAACNGIQPPGILDLHMRYRSAIITIYSLAESARAPGELNRVDTRTIKLLSARRVCSLLGKFVSCWSQAFMPLPFIRYANLALSTLLGDLDNNESKAGFINTYKSLISLASKTPVAAQVLQQVQEQASQSQLHLPQEVVSLNWQPVIIGV